MSDKPKKPAMEQLTDKMEDLEVDQEQSKLLNNDLNEWKNAFDYSRG